LEFPIENRESTNVTAEIPQWSTIVDEKYDWQWKGSMLVDRGQLQYDPKSHRSSSGLAALVVKYVYGRQNQTKTVKNTIRRVVGKLVPGQFGLNFGCGGTRLDKDILNLDVRPSMSVDLLSSGTLEIPLKDSSLHLIVCQEVLEHVRNPYQLVDEFHRKLADGGQLVLQVPFIIGYHPGPEDLWRFTVEAFAMLLPEKNWKIETKEISVGHGTALHRILTEFLAVNFSFLGGRVYRLLKGIGALAFLPLVLFDLLTPWLPERDRIPGGYIVVARAVKTH
jgi:SAM-dependent methyltransferase